MRRVRRTRAAVATVAAAALLLTACGSDGSSDDSAGGAGQSPEAITIATQTPPSSMDPVDASGGSIPYFQAVYDTLIHRNADGSHEPWLATDWEFDESRTTLTLTLREDVTFDDGTPLDAEAVKANLDRFKEAGGAEAVRAETTESVEVVDDYTVALHFESPDPAVVDALSDAYGFIANPSGFDSEDPFAVTPDGTGPYLLDEEASVTGSQWVFTQREDWWGEELPFSQITYLVLNDENAIVNGLLTGQVDAATLQGPVDRVADDPSITLTPQEIDLKVFTLFDRSGSQVEALGDQRVRQAINYAIDRQALVDAILDGRGTATSQMWSPNAPGYLPELDSHYGYDPARAQDLMAEAGYSDVSIRLARLPGLVNDALAEALRSQLAEIGITLEWVDVDQNGFVQRTFYDREFPGVVMNGGQSAGDWSTYLGVVAPSPTSNPQGATDEVIQEQAQIIRTGTEEEAMQAAQEMNRRVVELAWFVPLFRMEYAHAAVEGVQVTPQVGLAVPAIYNYAPTS